jgi:hypothetical protein
MLLDTSSEDAVWRSVYAIAGMCHPECGGSEDQMRELLRVAAGALDQLGAAPPPFQGPPSMRDIFDHATSAIRLETPCEDDTGNSVEPAHDGMIVAATTLTFEPLAFPDGWAPATGLSKLSIAARRSSASASPESEP